MFCVVKYILVVYFIHDSFYQPLLTPHIIPLPSLTQLLTTSLFSIAVSLLFFFFTKSNTLKYFIVSMYK